MGSQNLHAQEIGSHWDKRYHSGLWYDTNLVIFRFRWIKPDIRRMGKGQGNHFPAMAGITAQAGGQTQLVSTHQDANEQESALCTVKGVNRLALNHGHIF